MAVTRAFIDAEDCIDGVCDCQSESHVESTVRAARLGAPTLCMHALDEPR